MLVRRTRSSSTSIKTVVAKPIDFLWGSWGPITLRISRFPAQIHVSYNIFLKRLTTCLFACVTSLFASTKVWCQFGINDGDKHENGDDGAINTPAKTAMAVFLQSSSSTAKTPPRNTETTLLIGTRNEVGEDSKNLGRQTGDSKRPSLLAQRHIRILLLIEGLFSVGVCTNIHLQSGDRFCVPGVGWRNGTARLAGREWRQEPSWFAFMFEKWYISSFF